jgi:hypothetical protein
MNACVRPDRLADYARGRLQSARAAAIAQHLSGCDGCRVKLDRITGAHRALRDAAEAPVPDVGSVRTEATIRWTRVPRQAAVRPAFWFGLGAAACAAGVCLLLARPAGVASSASPRVAVAPRVAPSPVSPPPAVAAAGESAMVTLLGGDVRLWRGGKSRALDAATLLIGGDRLITGAGARVAVQWGSGSGLLLTSDAELAFSALTATEQSFELARGRADLRVGRHQPGEQLAVRTPSHVVTVHGTWFTVAADGARTTVEVYEGVVEVAERGGRATTLLHAPATGVFGPGRAQHGPLDAAKAAQRRAESEVNLVPWPSLEAARAATALLAVASTPEGALSIDGVQLGQTPMAVRRPIGRHLVDIVRDGFHPLRKWVTVGVDTGELRMALPRVADEQLMEPVAVEEMVRARGRQIRACYERGLKRDPTLAGTVSLKLAVGDVGQVRRVSVEESTLADPVVADCLKHEAAGWAFKTGRNATVVYPFVFRAQ